MALMELKRSASLREARQFGLVWLPALCLIVLGMSIWRGYPGGVAMAAAAVAITSVALSVVRPAWMRGVLIAWLWLVFPIGWLVAHLLLAGIYFLVVTPIGMVMRALGRDPLDRAIEPKRETYWIARRRQIDPADYFRQF